MPAATWLSLGFMPLAGFQISQVTDRSEALTAATKLLDAGTDGIKFYAATPGRNGAVVPEDAIKAGVEEAHRRGKPAFAHPSTEAGLLASIRAGIDVVSHTTPQSGPWVPSVIEEMKRTGVALIPTLKLWEYEFRHEPVSQSAGLEEIAKGQLRAWLDSGGVILFGTDVGYMSEYDPAREYELMAQAGMSFRQVLASLTTAPAEKFGDARHAGRVEPGYDADLTVVKGDPAADINALAAVECTLRDGRVIYRRRLTDSRAASLSAATAPPATARWWWFSLFP